MGQGRPRDVQCKRVYDAEDAVAIHHQTIPNEGLQPFVDKVLDRAPVKRRWGKRAIRVELGRGGGKMGLNGVMSLGVKTRNETYILHEVAHHLVPETLQDHGPEFVWTYLFLVKMVLGQETHDVLRKSMREHRVRVKKPTFYRLWGATIAGAK